MGKQNRLGVLHVRHAGHGYAEIGLGLLEKSTQQLEQRELDARCCIHHKEAKIGCDQFVAAASGVQLPAERAEFMHERTFDEVMDIFSGGAFQERRIVVYPPGDVIECEQGVMHFRGSENADALQGFRPRAIDGELVGEQATVERERALERVELFVGFAFEAAAPEAVVFALGLCTHSFCKNLLGFGSLRSLQRLYNRSIVLEKGAAVLRPYSNAANSAAISHCRFRLWLSGAPLPEARKD